MIPPNAIQELNEALQDQLAGDTPQVRLTTVGGVKAAAEISQSIRRQPLAEHAQCHQAV